MTEYVPAELPGIDEKDVDISLDHNMLTIKGEKKEESEDKKKDYHLSERSYGMFQRSFPLPDGLDEENVKANFKKGVLTVTLPKTKEAIGKRKRVRIEY